MNNIRSFFSMTKYETIRVMRNKVILFTLLGFAIVLLSVMSLLQNDNYDIKACMFTNGENVDDLKVMDFLKQKIDFDDVIIVDSEEEGKLLVLENKYHIFIYLDNFHEPTTALLYYNHNDNAGLKIRDSLFHAKYKWAYNNIYYYLLELGFQPNNYYFNGIDFEAANTDEVDSMQRMFGTMAASCIAIIIMFGLAYSVSRDKETNVSSNLNTLPISANCFLASKIVPYALLGILELIAILLLGKFAFDIHYRTNVFIIFVISLIFVFAVIMLGLMFSMLRNQIAASLFSMMTILFPIFINVLGIGTMPQFAQIIFNILPITSFIPLFDGLIFNGVIIWEYIVVLVLQIVIYYSISLMILKKQIQ